MVGTSDNTFQILGTRFEEKFYQGPNTKIVYILGTKNIFKPIINNSNKIASKHTISKISKNPPNFIFIRYL